MVEQSLHCPAHFGGGLYVKESTLNLPGDNIFTANWAGNEGGGICAQETKTSLSCNVAQLD